MELIDFIDKKKNDVQERKEKDNSHIAEWPRAYMTRHGFNSCARHVIFFVLYYFFSIEFWKFVFCLLSEVPSRDLDGEVGYRPC